MKNKLWLKLLSTKKGKIFLKSRDVTATYGNAQKIVHQVEAWSKGTRVGSINVSHYPKIGNDASVDGVEVWKESFRNLGISSRLFKEALRKADSWGKSFLRTNEIQHIAQVNIRSKYKTKFLGTGLGKFQDLSKVIKADEARNIITANRLTSRYMGTVKASTMVPKDINKLPKITLPKDKVRFIRKNGRIIPIRTKK
jgi:GNAT superfamily N-acetyltransferase